MKKSFLFTLASLSFVFCSFSVAAQSDDKYPAANFQPRVIFVDESVVKSSSATAGHPSSSQESSHKKTAFDPKYPAANFEPKVIYPDAG